MHRIPERCITIGSIGSPVNPAPGEPHVRHTPPKQKRQFEELSSSEVIFGLNNERYPYVFDRSYLRLGAIVFVEFGTTGKPQTFSSYFTESSLPYAVTWIAPSEWYVVLQDRFKIDAHFEELVIKTVGEYLEKEIVKHALLIAASDIRPEHMFKTSEFNNSRLAVICAVVQRLELCSKLNDPVVAKELFQHYRPLVLYLLLTCFDRLGQPSDWMDFGTWLKANSKKKEREIAVFKTAVNNSEIASELYNTYNSIYGVRHSIFRFLHEIIPPQVRNELLDSIWMEHIPNSPNPGDHIPASESEKEQYLYKLRNEYTHRAAYVPGVTKAIWPEGTIDPEAGEFFTQYFADNLWTNIIVKHWPELLEKIVHIGLAEYIRRID